jgi:PAS domain S-box-containing protein
MAEKFLTEKMLIISETDEYGNITFANQDFVDMSGYRYDELVGAPHNILRHPCMPKAAFEDLWKSIKANKIWNGFVCNLCKNQDHYWVYATVSAVTAANGTRRYISVRRKPTNAEIAYYSELYKGMA